MQPEPGHNLETESTTRRSQQPDMCRFTSTGTVGASVALLKGQTLRGQQRRSLRDIVRSTNRSLRDMGSQGQHTGRSLRDVSKQRPREELNRLLGSSGRGHCWRHMSYRSPLGRFNQGLLEGHILIRAVPLLAPLEGQIAVGGTVPSSASSES
jgi:hypothetical protein